MLRESDAPGARNLFVGVTGGGTGVATLRPEPGAETQTLGERLLAGPPPLFLRVQRIANEVQGFVSTDGRLWRALGGPRSLSLPETVQVGLAVASGTEGKLLTASFGTVEASEGQVSPTGLVACGDDGRVALVWRPIRKATGYLVYRGAPDAAADKLARLTSAPVSQASYTDSAAGLVNGTPIRYAVVPVLREASGTSREGLASMAEATPGGGLGLRACSIAEPVGAPGRMEVESETGTVSLRASETAIGGRSDRFFFAARTFGGDVQLTAKLFVRPSTSLRRKPSFDRGRDFLPVEETPPPARLQAGLMIRESLEPGARFFGAIVSPAGGAGTLWRALTDEIAEGPGEPLIAAQTLPATLWLRLLREGNTISAFTSTDGENFAALGEPYLFAENLPSTLYLGLALASDGQSGPVQAPFSDIQLD